MSCTWIHNFVSTSVYHSPSKDNCKAVVSRQVYCFTSDVRAQSCIDQLSLWSFSSINFVCDGWISRGRFASRVLLAETTWTGPSSYYWRFDDSVLIAICYFYLFYLLMLACHIWSSSHIFFFFLYNLQINVFDKKGFEVVSRTWKYQACREIQAVSQVETERVLLIAQVEDRGSQIADAALLEVGPVTLCHSYILSILNMKSIRIQ